MFGPPRKVGKRRLPLSGGQGTALPCTSDFRKLDGALEQDSYGRFLLEGRCWSSLAFLSGRNILAPV